MYTQEIFHSFQGEGPFVGYPQIFIRFFACNIKCAYCDTPDRNKTSVSAEEIVAELQPFLQKPFHSISITGGEPLLQVEGLKSLLPHIAKYPLYLETNGTLPKHLIEVADYFTYFAVDYKPGFDKEFLEFIEILAGRPNVFIKFVLTKNFPVQDTQKIAKSIAAIDASLPFVIQPVTPFAAVKEKATETDIWRTYNTVKRFLPDVRVIPQTHKMIGVR